MMNKKDYALGLLHSCNTEISLFNKYYNTIEGHDPTNEELEELIILVYKSLRGLMLSAMTINEKGLARLFSAITLLVTTGEAKLFHKGAIDLMDKYTDYVVPIITAEIDDPDLLEESKDLMETVKRLKERGDKL